MRELRYIKCDLMWNLTAGGGDVYRGSLALKLMFKKSMQFRLHTEHHYFTDILEPCCITVFKVCTPGLQGKTALNETIIVL